LDFDYFAASLLEEDQDPISSVRGKASLLSRLLFFSMKHTTIKTLLLICAVFANVNAATFNVLDRTIIVEYRILKREVVPVLIAADPPRTGVAAEAIERLGGQVVSRQDDIGYLYVRVKVEKVGELEKIDAIDAMQIAAQFGRGWTELQVQDGSTTTKKSGGPTPFLSIDNPFTAEYATQASQFKAANPTFDGRGVAVGIPEAADPSLPSMKGALDLRGLPVPKFPIYWWGQVARARPANAETRSNFWQYTEQVTPGNDRKITFNGGTYNLPDGVNATEWRICGRGLSTNSGELALWAVDKGQVWISTDPTKAFSKSPTTTLDASLPYATIRDDDPNRTDRYRGWVVVIDRDKRALAFGRTSAHAQMVASVLGGSHFLGSRAGGIAPAVQIASFVETGALVSDPTGLWEPLESILRAIKTPSVDIVQNAVLVADTGKELNTRVAALLLDRAVALTKKPAAISVSNTGPSFTGIFGLSMTFEGFAVGGYTPKETWIATAGFEPSAEITPAAYTSWGPGSDGSIKPDFLALTGTLCERTSANPDPPFERPYGLYTVSGGTSAASPHAAGHLALLISGAKQKGLKYDYRRLRAAIASTTRFLPSVEARVQGHGLIQVADAWQALRRANNWEPPVITSSANVTGRETSEAGRHQMQGRGLFETIGWQPGMSGVRDITVTRRSGPTTPKVYRLRWKDNSGAFSSTFSEVSLPLNRPVKIPVSINVKDIGSYSAILDLIDPEVDLVAHSVMAAILVPKTLDRAAGYRATIKNTLDRPGNSVALINVPPGMTALQVKFKRADGVDDLPADGIDNWQFIVEDPLGRRLPYSLWQAAMSEGRESTTVNGEQQQMFHHPIPGTWQFFFEIRFPLVPATPSKLKPTEVTWEFTGYDISSSAESETVTYTNAGTGDLRAKVTALGLGSERKSQVTVKPGLKAPLVELEIPEASKRLEIEIRIGDPKSIVGLYVYKLPDDGKASEDLGGTNYKPALIYYDNSGVTLKQFIVDSPKPGKYVVALDGLRVPAEGLSISYRDLVVNPVFGELTTANEETAFKAGESKSAKLSWTIAARPAGDRDLVAVTAILSSQLGYSKLSGTRKTASQKIELIPVAIATQTIPLSNHSNVSSQK
jgi:hypothetical protein